MATPDVSQLADAEKACNLLIEISEQSFVSERASTLSKVEAAAQHLIDLSERVI